MSPRSKSSVDSLFETADPSPISYFESDIEDAPFIPARARPSSFIHQHPSRLMILGLLFIIIFILSLGGGLMIVPSLRIFEQILCQNYYNELQEDKHIGFESLIGEEMCKGSDVQERLNVLMAVMWFLGTIPALVTTIPYGLLADRWGRRPVLALSVIGLIICNCYNFTVMAFWKVLPIYMIWASPIFIFIGGGEPVFMMMVFAIGTDITTEANRSTMFLYGTCAGLLAGFLAPSLASTLMARSPWIPLWLGMTLMVLGTILIIFMPETLHLKLDSAETLTPDTGSETSILLTKIDDTTFYTATKSQFTSAISRLNSATKVLHSIPILLLLVTFTTGPFCRGITDLLVRYVSNRYQWELRRAGFLLSLSALVNVVLIIVILPFLSHVLTSRLSYSGKSKDLILARGSILFLTIGAAMIGLAPTVEVGIIGIVIWNLGSGFTVLTRSLATTLVDQQHVGRLYAAISVVESASALAAVPIVAGLYGVGLRFQGPWMGLPFFCLAFVGLLSGVAVWSFGFVGGRGKDDEYEDEIGRSDEEDEERIRLVVEESEEATVGDS